jgi:predicted short-subunit dehydrogenase-like oxidoreductase (DUF2520 family)
VKIFLVGAGRLGRALAILLPRGDHTVTGLSNRTAAGAARTLALLGTASQATSEPVIPPDTELVWICTPDDQIEATVRNLTARGELRPDQIVAHSSGALPSAVLRRGAPQVVAVASAHPLFPFTDPHRSAEAVTAAAWFVEGEPRGAATLTRILEHIGIRPRPLRAEDRPVYHAAAALASNALTALVAAAAELMGELNLTRAEALDALLPLARAATDNLGAVGLPQALTGPIARGDAEVVRAHVFAIAESAPHLEGLYRELGFATVRLSRELGHAPPAALDAIEAALTGGGGEPQTELRK